MPETLFTVWVNLFERGFAAEGETVLVHGGTSGIGTMAIKLGGLFGLEVIVTCGSDEKCAAAIELGAAHAINYATTDFVDAVQRWTEGAGVAVVLDMVGGDYVPRNLQCLAEDGRHISIAFQRGASAEINIPDLMRRRLTLARALISNPDLLILDEPTTGLDPQARHVVWQKLRALTRAGVTMLLTTHYMEEAEQLCDRVLIMDRGSIIAGGTPRGLIREHIGAEVIELYADDPAHGDAVQVLERSADAVERAGDEVFGFFREADRARALLPALAEHHVVHRRATLEDVFLRLTGRELRE